jgi:hypothetical protein
MRFKAKLATTQVTPAKNGYFRMITTDAEITFSKTRIFFPVPPPKNAQNYYRIISTLHDLEEYKLSRLEKYEDIEEWSKDSIFQIETNNGTKLNLITDRINGIKLKIMHERYWVQKEYDWIFKYIITTLITVSVAIYAGRSGFNKGYQEGLKVGKFQTLSQPLK